jgi:ubiquinone/menaquinone biosynthesis C-methylase UbiE
MRKQQPRQLAPALIGTAEAIPFDDAAFDAATAILTVHHWKERAKSLREIPRVTRGPIATLTLKAKVCGITTLEVRWTPRMLTALLAGLGLCFVGPIPVRAQPPW